MVATGAAEEKRKSPPPFHEDQGDGCTRLLACKVEACKEPSGGMAIGA
eukprot:CAMPEP_0169121490 /NCGR_PEP_ID=MMETSP1015-20121227/32699_1 /TAXON_ID=342587 /ORGANISM="Karlodinium micrum, Strain CCMP2283" /LENGTH=47 /DNA_ID= /DNA_START= /DNA_END= /DNA_ORIENTATION=